METVAFSNEQELQELYDKYDEIIRGIIKNSGGIFKWIML